MNEATVPRNLPIGTAIEVKRHASVYAIIDVVTADQVGWAYLARRLDTHGSAASGSPQMITTPASEITRVCSERITPLLERIELSRDDYGWLKTAWVRGWKAPIVDIEGRSYADFISLLEDEHSVIVDHGAQVRDIRLDLMIDPISPTLGRVLLCESRGLLPDLPAEPQHTQTARSPQRA